MIEKKARHIYYLRGLTPPLVVIVGMIFANASLFAISTFLICYLWPYFIFTPGAKRRYSEYKYRWSLVGMLVRLNEVVEEGLPSTGFRKRMMIALFGPLLFCLLLGLISQVGEPLFAIGATALFALVYKFLLHEIASAEYPVTLETPAGDSPAENVNVPEQPPQNHQTDNDSNS